MNMLRPMVALSLAGSLSLGTYALRHEPVAAPSRLHQELSSALGLGVDQVSEMAFGDRYAFTELEYLQTTLFYLDEGYVEPDRLDYEAMFEAALEAVERKVPSCMFRRDAETGSLHIAVGDYRGVQQVPKVATSADLMHALRPIAQLMMDHLTPEQIPLRNPTEVPEDRQRAAFAEVEQTLINGALGTLDPHSVLLPPEDSKDMDVENQGHFGGLGITIVDRQGQLTVEYPLKDTPAMKAGVLADDRIMRIDGESTINMSLDEAVSRLRGPVGAPVTVEILRDGLSEPLPIRIVRAEIKLHPVEGELMEGNVGYISLSAFHAEVAQGLSDELTRLQREAGGSLKGLVLDLRGNPGGFLNQAVRVSDTFLKSGVIVSTVDGMGRKLDEQVAKSWGVEPEFPMVVLLDARSASASEIVAGALRNNDRAVIVGERSFGKGSVQNLRSFNDDSKLKYTTAKYLTPGDRSIQSVGIPADIELDPVIAERRAEDDGGAPFALVHWRERISREADLDKHLDHASARMEQPAYSATYLRKADVERKRTGERDLAHDVEVQFARDMVLAAPSARRADMLSAAAPIVARHAKLWDKQIEDAFTAIGIDWSAGPSVKDPNVELTLSVGGDGQLIAGDERDVTVTVTNRGAEPLYRLVAVASSDSGVLDGREFVFGKVGPGQTRSFVHSVHLVDGFPAERSPVKLALRDGGVEPLKTVDLSVDVTARPLPAFSWSWRVLGTNAELAAGQELELELTVTNTGDGAAVEPFARLKNQSGRSLDIRRGTVEPGAMVDDAGKACVITKPGIEAGKVVGDMPAQSGRLIGDAPGYAKDCHRSLPAGATWTGRFALDVKDVPEDGIRFELQVGDGAAYDHAAVVREGFYPYFTQREDVHWQGKLPLEPVSTRQPPTITVTRAPTTVAGADHATISGVVRDDHGIADVLVYKGSDKVFFQGGLGGEPLRSVPFTAEVPLDMGVTTLVILATDDEGHTVTRSVVTTRE